MIITVRGPSGSGKSTLVRAITAMYEGSAPFYIVGRKKALFTEHMSINNNVKKLIVPGHYDIPNGGIDTLPTLDAAYRMADEYDEKGYNILMEGKCMSDGVTHMAALNHKKRATLAVVHLDTSVEQCLASVRARGHNIALQSIQRTHRKVLTNINTFRDMGLHVFSGDRAACVAHVKELLGL